MLIWISRSFLYTNNLQYIRSSSDGALRFSAQNIHGNVEESLPHRLHMKLCKTPTLRWSGFIRMQRTFKLSAGIERDSRGWETYVKWKRALWGAERILVHDLLEWLCFWVQKVNKNQLDVAFVKDMSLFFLNDTRHWYTYRLYTHNLNCYWCAFNCILCKLMKIHFENSKI
jgi:hypothetical protein